MSSIQYTIFVELWLQEMGDFFEKPYFPHILEVFAGYDPLIGL